MTCDISKLKGLLSEQNSPEFKKSSDLSLGLIGMINVLFDGDFDSNEIKLTEDDFFSVITCGFFMFETFRTINLNGGHMSYSFTEDKYIHPESTVPRCVFLMCYGVASYDSESDAKAFFMDTSREYNELSNTILNIYMAHDDWGFLYDHLGISHLFKSKSMANDFENKMQLMNSLASS